MLTRREFIGGLAGLLAGCTIYERKPPVITVVPKETPGAFPYTFLARQENINKLARFLYEQDLQKIGESEFVIRGPANNITLEALSQKPPVDAYVALRAGTPLTQGQKVNLLKDLTWLRGERKEATSLEKEVQAFILGKTDHPCREYFLDIIRLTMDSQSHPTDRRVRSDSDVLLWCHTHPTHVPGLGLSEADHRSQCPAFAYYDGELVFLNIDADGREDQHKYAITDSKLVFDLDLVSAQLCAERSRIERLPTGEFVGSTDYSALTLHLERALSSPDAKQHLGEIESTLRVIAGQMDHRIQYLSYHDAPKDIIQSYRECKESFERNAHNLGIAIRPETQSAKTEGPTFLDRFFDPWNIVKGLAIGVPLGIGLTYLVRRSMRPKQKESSSS
ncbi:hypothetical protein HY493_04960 [Candidatus Woesearchaeota archaeon]|nr:hypothetical protein [Candidatus Woesearchaeota archaeon]